MEEMDPWQDILAGSGAILLPGWNLSHTLLQDMKGIIIPALLSFLLVTPGAQARDVEAPIFQVDLNAEPAVRWTPSVTYMINTYGFDHSFQNVLNYVTSIIPQPLLTRLEPELLELLKLFPGDAGEEIKGIHSTIDSLGYGDQISLGELAAINLMYEFTVFCTSIVAESEDGSIYHGRNLDYSIQGLQVRSSE